MPLAACMMAGMSTIEDRRMRDESGAEAGEKPDGKRLKEITADVTRQLNLRGRPSREQAAAIAHLSQLLLLSERTRARALIDHASVSDIDKIERNCRAARRALARLAVPPVSRPVYDFEVSA
jgi:hypothetical protein